MKFIIGNRKTRDQWNDTIVDTQKGFKSKNTNPQSDGSTYAWKYNDSVSESDTSPQV